MFRIITAVAATVLAANAFTGPAANAVPIDSGHFTDVIDSGPYDCNGLVMAADTGTVSVNFTFNQRGTNGQNPFPYYRESIEGTIVTTNLDTLGTYTNHFTGNSRDHKIVDNGNGTITITVQGSGGSQYFDQFGNLVLKDPGMNRFAFDVNYNGTPGDASDDTEVPNSFRVVKPSTGRNDLEGRDFCTDLALFTS